MRRSSAIFLTGATALNFLLWSLTATLWVRSYESEGVLYSPFRRGGSLIWIIRGECEFQFATGMKSVPLNPAASEIAKTQLQARWEAFGVHYSVEDQVKMIWNPSTSSYQQTGGAYGTVRIFSISLWWPFLIIGGLFAAGLRSVIRRCRYLRRRRGHCLTCGYDLRATPDRCPECGTAPAHAKC